MPKKPGVAPSLTREEILAKALELADEHGIQNVSMRKLAAALGKAPMALYTYFGSIQEIHAGAVTPTPSPASVGTTPCGAPRPLSARCISTT